MSTCDIWDTGIIADSIDTTCLLVYGYIRLLIEDLNTKLIIPDGIKLMLQRYFGVLMHSKILTTNEKEILLGFLKDQTSKRDWKWKLLHRATEHGWKRNDFIRTCKNVSNYIMIIHNNEDDQDQVFGGYTPCPATFDHRKEIWDAIYHPDESMSTFIFILRADLNVYKDGPQAFELQECKSDEAVKDHYLTAFSFGCGGDLLLLDESVSWPKKDRCKVHTTNHWCCFEWNQSEEYEDLKLCGNNGQCMADEIEIFQLYQ